MEHSTVELRIGGVGLMSSEAEAQGLTPAKTGRWEIAGLRAATVSGSKPVGSPYVHKAGGSDHEAVADLQRSLAASMELYCVDSSMESLLQKASRLVVEILDLEHCSVGWLDENDLSIRVCTSHTREGVEVDADQVLDAISNFVRRERPIDPTYPQPLCVRSYAHPAPGLIAPLRVGKQIVGYLYGLKDPLPNVTFLGAYRPLFVTLSQHISSAIEVQRTREMLDYPYVALALNAREEGSAVSLLPVAASWLEASSSSEKLTRTIARRFFGDLRKAGLETKQIMWVVTEILDGLNEFLLTKKPGSQNG